jgi:hypothetical protein
MANHKLGENVRFAISGFAIITLSKTLNLNTFNGPLNVPNLGWKSADWG